MQCLAIVVAMTARERILGLAVAGFFRRAIQGFRFTEEFAVFNDDLSSLRLLTTVVNRKTFLNIDTSDVMNLLQLSLDDGDSASFSSLVCGEVTPLDACIVFRADRVRIGVCTIAR